MIKHYLKNAIKALSRNKFVSFINIFGISFTLLVTTIVFAFINLEWGTDNPNENKFNIVSASHMEMIAYRYDTIFQLDSSFIEGALVYDTLDFELKKQDGVSNAMQQISYPTIKKYLSNIKEAKDFTFYTDRNYNIFLPSGKLNTTVQYTNDHFWNIYPYKLISGRYFNDADVTNKEPVMLITQAFAKKYFGDKPAQDQIVKMDGKSWQVIGILKDPREYSTDCFVPFTHLPEYELNSESPLGSFTVVFLTENKHQVNRLCDELAAVAKTIDPYKKYTDFFFYPQTFAESFATGLLDGSIKDRDKSLKKMHTQLTLFGFFFFMLPILNLLNINLSRIFERKSEIGIRKSFGANNTHIFAQFLFESILLSIISGVIALVASYFILNLINKSEILSNALELNTSIILYGVLASLIFGFLFGALPAVKLSQLNIVQSLKK